MVDEEINNFPYFLNRLDHLIITQIMPVAAHMKVLLEYSISYFIFLHRSHKPQQFSIIK